MYVPAISTTQSIVKRVAPRLATNAKSAAVNRLKVIRFNNVKSVDAPVNASKMLAAKANNGVCDGSLSSIFTVDVMSC